LLDQKVVDDSNPMISIGIGTWRWLRAWFGSLIGSFGPGEEGVIWNVR